MAKIKTTVKSVLERQEPPTTSTLFWSRLPGKFVDRLTGQETKILSIQDPIEWAQGLLTVVQDQANTIHRKTLHSPANFIITNGFGFVLLESLVTYRPLLFGEPNSDIGVEFDDAIQMGSLNGRFAVFKSQSIPEDKMLLGLAGHGVDFRMSNTNPMDIEVVKTDNPYHQVGQVAYWAYVQILDMGL